MLASSVTPEVQADGVTGAPEIPHGTSSGYGYHRCRCDVCKAFKSEQSRAQYERRIGRPVRVPKSPEQLAHENRVRVDKWRRENPEKRKVQAARYRAKHREQIRAQQLDRYRRLMAEDPERVRKARRDWLKTPKGRKYKRYIETLRRRGVPYSADALDWIASLVDPACHYCDEPATEIDHLTPISRGGTGDLENLAPACRSCNASKGDKTESEFVSRKELA